MFVLDTGHVAVLQRQAAAQYDHLMTRIRRHEPSAFFVSIVSFHEQVMGWNAYLSRAKDSAGVVRGYDRLQRVLSNFADA